MKQPPKRILVTGATGTFGAEFIEIGLSALPETEFVIFSRDELKQSEMRNRLQEPRLHFSIGDVRDFSRVRDAMCGADVVIHAAALKRVDTCEEHPSEAVSTNVTGTQSVVRAAAECGVERALILSTDKAVHPVNIYGATKLCAEKIFLHGSPVGGGTTRFSCVRYGNVVGSRGSVIPLFQQQVKEGRLTITDRRMTRFWISPEQSVRFVLACLKSMVGGEIFVPKIPSMSIADLAAVIGPEIELVEIGMSPGEKLHEVLISAEEAPKTREFDTMFVLQPSCPEGGHWSHGSCPEDGFSYTSDNNDQWLSSEALHDFL